MKVDLSKSGLDMFFKPYQKLSLSTLWEYPDGLNTREVWKKVNDQMELTISRASIINFLAYCAEQGILQYRETTGKGGYRRIYYHKYNRDELSKYLKKAVKETLSTLT
jgi:predicted transcriptional regulator